MVAQVFRLQQPHGGETSMRKVFDVVYPMGIEQRRHVSINSARWLPEPGMGLAYGTNKGDLVICRPVGPDPSWHHSGPDMVWVVKGLQVQVRRAGREAESGRSGVHMHPPGFWERLVGVRLGLSEPFPMDGWSSSSPSPSGQFLTTELLVTSGSRRKGWGV
ncbi:hypothetical protein NFI96_001815 [Prochilodus magdalenae]|nr:hypothetical protein NFI96_001815 [Prochilodus magdalenae]